jgi:hypothetical protein
MLGTTWRLPRLARVWPSILTRSQWSGGHQVARRLLKRNEEAQLDAQLQRVRTVLDVMKTNSHFKQMLQREKISKVELRHAVRALLSNPLAVDEAFQVLPRDMSAVDAAKTPEIRGALIDIIRVYRMPQYREVCGSRSSSLAPGPRCVDVRSPLLTLNAHAGALAP